jgi:hypothetical protein
MVRRHFIQNLYAIEVNGKKIGGRGQMFELASPRPREYATGRLRA